MKKLLKSWKIKLRKSSRKLRQRVGKLERNYKDIRSSIQESLLPNNSCYRKRKKKEREKVTKKNIFLDAPGSRR